MPELGLIGQQKSLHAWENADEGCRTPASILHDGNAMQAYGSKGVMEIPPNATLNMDVQLLTIKTSPFGYRTKLVEG